MKEISNAHAASTLLDALGAQLGELEARCEIVVVGGSALLALGLVSRTTRDVDLVAMREGSELRPVDPLPRALDIARTRVARDFQLPVAWLNAGPAALLTFGLPAGFMARAQRREHGPALTAWYASRFDQIHLKLYATVDQGVGKHESDLRALQPTERELLAAARWSRTHDPSEGYRDVLGEVLRAFGVDDAALGP
jgi:hypothetical protein